MRFTSQTLWLNASLQWRLCLAGIFCFSIAFYLPSLSGKPLWDDVLLLSSIGPSHQSVEEAVRQPFMDCYFRPLAALSLVFDGRFGHQAPAYFHATNIVLHAATTVFVACLGLLVTDSRRVGVLSGFVFAVLPWEVGATAWIGGRPDVLATFFLTLSLSALVAFYRHGHPHWIFLSALSFLFAGLAKEQSLAALPVFPLSEYAFGHQRPRRAVRVTIPFFLCTLLFGLLFEIIDPVSVRTLPRAPGSVATQFALSVTHYFRAVCLPNRAFFVSYNFQPYDSIGWILFGFAIAIVIGVMFVWFLRHRPKVAWLVAAALCTAIPASNLLAVPLLIGPYRVALSGPAFACFLAMTFWWAVRSRVWIVVGLVGANFLAEVNASWWGMHQWADGFQYFSEVLTCNPGFTLGRTTYIDQLLAARRMDEAIRQIDINLAYIFGGSSWQERMKTLPPGVLPPDAVNRLMLDGPRSNQLHAVAYLLYDRATAHESLNKIALAREDLRGALIYWPDNALLHFMYGQSLLPVDRITAVQNMHQACRLQPTNVSYSVKVVPLEIQLRRWTDAEIDAQSFVKQMPQVAISWMFDADAAMQLGDFARAEADLRSAKGKPIRDPSDLELRWNRLRKLEEAHRAPVARTLP